MKIVFFSFTWSISVYHYNKQLVWRFFIGFPLSVLKSCHANAMPMPCQCLQGQSVVRQSLTDAFEQRRMGHLEMPICPSHLKQLKQPKAKVMMSDDLLGFTHQKCRGFPMVSTWFHHEKWWFKDQEYLQNPPTAGRPLRHQPCRVHLWCMPGYSATRAPGH